MGTIRIRAADPNDPRAQCLGIWFRHGGGLFPPQTAQFWGEERGLTVISNGIKETFPWSTIREIHVPQEKEEGMAEKSTTVQCDNCGRIYRNPTSVDVIPLNEVPGLSVRLDPGAEVPYGECNDCGCFVYLVEESAGLLRTPAVDTYPCGHPKTPGDDICSNLGCNSHLRYE